MSDFESDSESSFASEVDELEYRGGAIAKKKAAAAASVAEKRAAAAVAAASAKKPDAASDADDDEDDESTVADDDESAAEAIDSDADDESAAAAEDDEDEPFNDDDGDEDDAAAGRNIPARFEINEQDDDDADEDDYMGKFDESTRKNVIEQFYPELIEISYEEANVLTETIRDKDGFIVDNLHKTLPIMTKYEKTRILGERARQLGTGAQPMIEVDEDIIDPYLIAVKELEAKKIPYLIKRPIPNGAFEIWSIRDLEVI